MFKSIASWCRKLAQWLDPVADVVVPVKTPIVDSTLVEAARFLILDWESRLGAGFGEAKRHQVYASLIKQFPEQSKRSISLIIERILNGEFD